MRIGAVVLHYRFWPEVRATLDALLSQTRPPDELIVVDNHSDDASADAIRNAYPAVSVVDAGRNGGYAAGMNVGIAQHLAGAAHAVLLLTHECRLAPDALRLLEARLVAAPEVAAVGPLLAFRSRPDTVFSAGGRVKRRNFNPVHVTEPPYIADWHGRGPLDAEWLDGACILIRADVLRTTGPLDERYFLCYEEAEYLMRIRARGLRVECVPAAVAWQEPGNLTPYLSVRNRLGFVARNAPKRFLVRELLRDIVLIAASRHRTDYARGLADFLRNRWGPPSHPHHE